MVAIIANSPIGGEFVWTIRGVSADHVLLGSDYPQYSLEQNASALDRLDLSDAERNMVRHQNARRLLRPGAPFPLIPAAGGV